MKSQTFEGTICSFNEMHVDISSDEHGYYRIDGDYLEDMGIKPKYGMKLKVTIGVDDNE